MICIRHHIMVRKTLSYVYNIGYEKALTGCEVDYLDILINCYNGVRKKICEIDNWCLILNDINDSEYVEKILIEYWDIFTEKEINREKYLSDILEGDES